ncbi:MAG: hypothetical protein HY301_04080 [Verrucomicrobia bacterium]|nr:hypothetical protein [Verrucomicrobiota bacterium]
MYLIKAENSRTWQWVVPILAALFGFAFIPGCSSTRSGEESGRSVPSDGRLRLEQLKYESANSKARAISLLEALQIEPQVASNRLQLARILLKNQYPAPAITLLNHPSCRAAEDPNYTLMLASALQMHSPTHQPEIARVLGDAVKRFPNSPKVHIAFGHSLNSTDRASDALAEFETALKQRPDSEDVISARLGRIAALKNLGRNEESDRELAQLKRLVPDLTKYLREISVAGQITPPRSGETLASDGVHPPPDERKRRVLQEIERLSKESK